MLGRGLWRILSLTQQALCKPCIHSIYKQIAVAVMAYQLVYTTLLNHTHTGLYFETGKSSYLITGLFFSFSYYLLLRLFQSSILVVWGYLSCVFLI